MLDSKYETHNKAGLLTALNVLKNFQQSIISIKQTQVMGGVDLAREERLQKCEQVIDGFFEISKSKSFLKSMARPGEVKDIAMEFNRVLQNFLN